MGTSTSAREFAGKMARLAGQVGDTTPALIEMAEAGKAIFRSTATQAGALGVKLGGKRRKIGVRDDFVRGNDGNKAVIVSYTGPAHILNNPTKAHPIYRQLARARGSGARRINRERSLAATFGGTGAYSGGSLKFSGTGGVVFRKVVHHPGTAGMGFYQKAETIVRRTVPPIGQNRILTQPLRSVIGR